MKKPNNTDLAIDTTAGALVALSALTGPIGVAVATVLVAPAQDIFKRLLSPKERSRIESVVDMARKQIEEEVKKGTPLRTDFSTTSRIAIDLEELEEGTLITARDSYEEKKLPLLANICTRALFTNSPIDNLTQSLHTAEILSYRQLCTLCLFYSTIMRDAPGLSDLDGQDNKRNDEEWEGAYNDLWILMREGLLIPVHDKSITMVFTAYHIVPNDLVLTRPGLWLVNSMARDNCPPESDVETIREILK